MVDAIVRAPWEPTTALDTRTAAGTTDLRDAEITRLRALVEELKADRIRINDEAEAEIKKLREALKKTTRAIEQFSEWAGTNDYDAEIAVARKALEGGE